jgi:hypothetical protein
LHTIRSQVELYKSQHDGKLPTATLVELYSKTNNLGTVGTGTAFPYGPYLQELPTNPFTNSATVRSTTGTNAAPPAAASGAADAGWLYNATTGNVFIDNADLLTE